MADDIDSLIALFSMLRISNAPAMDEYPSGVLGVSDSPVPLGEDISVGVLDLCIWVEVFATDSGSTSPKDAAERASTPDPMRAMMQNLSVTIGTNVNANSAAEALARLQEGRKCLPDEAATLSAMQRRLESAQWECDAAYGFKLATAKPSQVAEVRNRGTAIGRALGAVPPI